MMLSAVSAVLVASVTLAACKNDGSLEDRVTKLEASNARLETDNAKYRDELEWFAGVYKEQHAQAEAQEANEPDPNATFAVDVARDVAIGQVEGPATACVTVVEAWDFACPYCQKVSSTLEQLVKDYGGKVRVVYKNMVIHPQAAMAGHRGACAAAKQGKFIEYLREWWDKAYAPYAEAQDSSKLGVDTVLEIARDLHLDDAKFRTDMISPACRDQVQSDMAELEKWHINATPSFFINGRSFQWGETPTSFKTAIDVEIKKVEGSGVPCSDYYQKVVIDKGEKQFRSKKPAKPS